MTEAIPLCDIGERDGWRRMKAGGLNVTTKTSLRAVLGDYLQLHGDSTRWNMAKTTGWQYRTYALMPVPIVVFQLYVSVRFKRTKA
ncbi:hypothetical protein [Pantoea agglomerans]|uniref:hypothetical protein n=1 Tax=Enterobacter agglomerans TaxID=549 RepID=UPI001780A79B|nr:hypothetical protein [Pantoea agglomerans]MBD8133136.1 hypothetical protein [Pantoea agglomerans]